MLKAKIPSTGEELLRIGLGTYKTFDVGNDAAKRKELAGVLKVFVEAGGSLIDSSPMYGTSEAVIGEVSKDAKVNDKLFVATKVWTSGKEEGIRQMNDSINKMGRKKIELMQIHNLVDWKTQLVTLRKWKDEGRFRYIGITHYSPGAFGEMEQILKTEKMDFLQIPFSLNETDAEKSLIPLAASKGVAVIANEPFDQGALFRMTKGKPLPGWCKEFGIESWAQYFLKFILSNKDIGFAIPGTGKIEHMKDNIKAAFGELPTADLRSKMNAIL